jgi:hypothetical protein
MVGLSNRIFITKPMGKKEIRLDGLVWINLAQDKNQKWAPVNTVMNLPVLYKARNLLIT